MMVVPSSSIFYPVVCNTMTKKAIMTAIIKGYHKRLTQILPRKDVALVM
jgi:DNA replicative helicase MCM subunit Mcm2 (Cdc46/Mcm family)